MFISFMGLQASYFWRVGAGVWSDVQLPPSCGLLSSPPRPRSVGRRSFQSPINRDASELGGNSIDKILCPSFGPSLSLR